MKKSSIIFFRAVIVLAGVGALGFMLWEPQVEGRNAHATLFEIYFKDPFLAYAYLSSTPFFAALYQAFRLLGYIGQDKEFPAAARALRIIKFCALALVCLVAAPVACLFIVRPGDDIAGGVAIGLFLILVSGISAAAAALLERRYRARLNS